MSDLTTRTIDADTVATGYDDTSDRTARLRLLIASAIGVALLFVAHWLAPQQDSLVAAPAGAVGWIAVICGVVGVWLVPGLWISAVLVRLGVGPVGWIGTRIATTLAWYAAVGPVIHHVGRATVVTTLGILAVTTAATAAVSLGVAFGLSQRPTGRWRRSVVAVVAGGGCAQIALWVSRLWIDEAPYMRNVVLDVVIVLAGALLVVAGALSSPQLPPRMSARDIRTTLIALAAIALTAVALTVVNANWSPAQRMPSSFAAEQIPAPAGADLALSLTALGPDGPEMVRRADFSAYDIAGRPVPVDIRLVLTDGMGERATLLVELPRSSQAQLCGPKQLELARTAGAPIKLTMRDNASDMTLQAVIPIGWCTG